MIALLCLVAYSLASCVVGLRLLLRAARSRGIPELLAGLCYLCAPGVGYPLQVVSMQLPDRHVAIPMNVSGEALMVFGCSCFLFFTVRVFRPEVRWAAWCAWLGTFGLLYAGVGTAIALIMYVDPAESMAQARFPGAMFLLVLACVWGWTALESLRYYRMMRKRMALGLADAVVTNRFLLWSLNGLTSVGWLSVAITMYARGVNLATSPLAVSTTSAGGLANAVLLLLIFMPPAPYLRWIERSARNAALAAA
jgi:hypothetical protein